MEKSLNELIKRIEICREGKCGDCVYSKPAEYCTDGLIDDLYEYLLGLRGNNNE